VPDLEGRESFSGRVVHSSGLGHLEIEPGQRVVVVGAGKSALDCAVLAAQRGAPTTLVFRQPHWMVPRFFFGLIRTDYLLLSRFSEMFFKYHRLTRAEAFLHGPARFLVRLWWRQNNALIRFLLHMPPVFRPDVSLPAGFENTGVGEEFYRALRQGKLGARRASVSRFTETGLELSTGERLEADLVVFATGWRQGVGFLSPSLRDLVQRDGRFQLYRLIVPPRLPRIGFIGYASSIACQFTSEVAAHWLSECFQGSLKLPSVGEMEEEIRRVHRWLSEALPRRDQGYFIGPHIGHYADELLADMGVATRRAPNLVGEYMAPFRPARYATLGAERKAIRARAKAPLPT
jgi:cation diffusion facilitator CzcD-associated flavoprotein CzcO